MTGERVHHTDSAQRTAAWGGAVAALCTAGDVIALQGELGAGKTQFTRGLAAGLGVDPSAVSSPTFTLVQEYGVEGRVAGKLPGAAGGGVDRLVHIDAYRLSDAEELGTIGWEGEGEELRAGAVVAIEWAARVAGALGPDVLWVELGHAAGGRSLRLVPRGVWVDRIKGLREPE